MCLYTPQHDFYFFLLRAAMIEESNPPDKNNPILASEIKFKLTAFSKSISIFLSLLSLFEEKLKYLFF